MSKLITKLVGVFVVCVGLMIAARPSSVLAATDTAALDTTVSTTLTLGLSSNAMNFGNLSPGTPLKGTGGIIATVNTSAADGYLLGISDGIPAPDSCLVHTDGVTYIEDYLGTITTPTLWSGTGLGFTVYAADTNKEAKWGTGTTYNDSNNKYAGVPQTTTTFHSSPSYKAVDDTTSFAFELDAPNDQKTGNYSGDITITATAVVS